MFRECLCAHLFVQVLVQEDTVEDRVWTDTQYTTHICNLMTLEFILYNFFISYLYVPVPNTRYKCVHTIQLY